MKSRVSRSIQSGFTLIELIVVIVILGILAAVAVPQFIDFSTDARRSVVKGVEGTMRSAANLVYSKASVASNSAVLLGANGGDAKLSINNEEVSVVYGYPASFAELKKVINLDADFVDNAGGDGAMHSGAPTPEDCSVTYDEPADANETPTITFTGTGC